MTESVPDTTVTTNRWKERDYIKADICRTWLDDIHRVLERYASRLRLTAICFMLMMILSDIRTAAQLKTNIFLASTLNDN